jgi:sulfite reductase (NADPH) flavoprotein alpha-component
VINCWQAQDKTWKTGGCTKYIKRVPVGAKIAFQVVCGTFQFPPDDTYPMVMTGLGTGIAPIRSFVQDRLYQKRQGKVTGPMVVFYGCRHEKEEFFYKEEWEMYKKEGVLTELINAFSHDPPHYPPKMVFVSHKMEDNPELMHKYLYEQKGYFYMCGPAFATPGIEAATKQSVQKMANLGQTEVDSWFEKLHLEGRYSIESY